MEIVRAKKAGFCMGVDLALYKLEHLIARETEPGSIYILGSIIHNPQVVEEYARRGVTTLTSPAEAPSGATVVIRAHGIARNVREDLHRRGVTIVDATCPKVTNACLRIEKHTAGGRTLLLYGDETHPEVKALLSYAGGPTYVFNSRQALAALTLQPGQEYCLAAQTTQDKEIFSDLVRDLQERGDFNLVVLQTICSATKQRQEEAIRIAREVDFVIVAGGYESSNTKRLAQVVAAQGTPVLHVEKVSELPLAELKNYSRIGLTAGASTPQKVIDEIQRALAAL
ncbi:MAG: 4-hydroxy-3-methylbut-2-enyl diphosphate reductase [Desulfuromonadales bacterium]